MCVCNSVCVRTQRYICSHRRGLAEVWMAKQSHVHFDSQICGFIKINYLDLRSIYGLALIVK
jgi:hypothetical protein